MKAKPNFLDSVRQVVEDFYAAGVHSGVCLPCKTFWDSRGDQVIDWTIAFSRTTSSLELFDRYISKSSFAPRHIAEARRVVDQLETLAGVQLCEIGDFFLCVRVIEDSGNGLVQAKQLAQGFNVWICEQLRGQQTDGPPAKNQPGPFFTKNRWLYLGIP